MFRQGDILLIPLPSGNPQGQEQPAVNGAVVLAHGEATGHAHVIRSPRARLFQDESRMLLRVEGLLPVELTHEEHATLSIPAGHYQVVRQREYTPEAIRQVSD